MRFKCFYGTCSLVSDMIKIYFTHDITIELMFPLHLGGFNFVINTIGKQKETKVVVLQILF